MWGEYFTLVGIVPGVVVIPTFGKVDFREENLPVKLIQEIYESDCRYLKLTAKGEEKLYGIKLPPMPKRKKATVCKR
jgi:hypothetical protein